MVYADNAVYETQKGVQFAGIGLDTGGGGGGSSYTLPTATPTRLGGVKIGSGVSVGDDGTITVNVPHYPDTMGTFADTGAKWIDGRRILALYFRKTTSTSINTDWTYISFIESTDMSKIGLFLGVDIVNSDSNGTFTSYQSIDYRIESSGNFKAKAPTSTTIDANAWIIIKIVEREV